MPPAPLRVLVCGTNYGRVYLSAVRQSPSTYVLAGLLARGSARSRRLAENASVPLYRRVSELADDVDVACVATGSSGFHVVLELLERRVHVLCEHPQAPTHLRAAVETADRNGVCFHVNSHFGDLDAAAAFRDECSKVLAVEEPCFVSVMASDRALWGALDILRRTIGVLEPFELSTSREVGPFHLMRGSLGGIPCTFQIQRTVSADGAVLEDGSAEYLVDLRLAIGFSTGLLSLLSVAGPVVWNANLTAAVRAGALWRIVSETAGMDAGDLASQRAAANLKALDRLAREIRTGVRPREASTRHVIEVGRIWEELGRTLRSR